MEGLKKVFIYQWLIFFTAFFVALLSFWRLLQIVNLYAKTGEFVPREFSAFEMAAAVIIASLVFLFFMKFARSEKFKRAFIFFIFGFLSLWGTFFILSLWVEFSMAVTISLVLVALVFYYRNVLLNNIAMLLAVPAAVINLAISINLDTAVLFLLGLTIYDYIAVYKTKHMVYMAKSMIRQGLVFGFVFPKKTEYLNSKLPQVVGEKSKEKAFVMGGGDIALPLLFVTTIMKYNLQAAFFVSFFAFAGLFLSFAIFYMQKDKQPIPALPPIALMCFIGYLLYDVLV